MSLHNDILSAYADRPTIRGTANRCGCSREIVRRVLITAGLITSPFIEQVRTLSNLGLSTMEIADRLNCARSTVAANAPYTRYTCGCHNDYTPTPNAIRVRRYKIKKEREKEKMGNL